MGFNLAPTPGGGSGSPYGGVPGAIGAPPSIFSQVNANVPGAAPLAGASAANIGSELNGQLSTGTQNLLQNKAASLGVNVGQPAGAPGNTISNQNFLDQLGLTSEGLSHEGNQDYLSFLGGVGATQLSPNLLTDIASNNATMAAAPNPELAAQQQQYNLLSMYGLNRPSGPTYANSAVGKQNSNAPLAGSSYLTPGSTDWKPGYLPGPL